MVGVFFTLLDISFIINKVFKFVVVPGHHDDQLKFFIKYIYIYIYIYNILFFEEKCLVQGVVTTRIIRTLIDQQRFS